MALAIAVMVSSYQNCAQNSSGLTPESASDQDNHIVTAMESRSITSDTRPISEKSLESCRQENLHCLRKVYSPIVQDRQTAEVLCLESSGHCFDVSSVFYNTTFALQECESCGPEAARPGGEYHREEVTCWVGQPGTSDSASYALRSDLESAVHAALAACGGVLQ